MWLGRQAFRMVTPGIGARFQRMEHITALMIRDAAPTTKKIGVDRCVMPVDLVDVATGGIGLPDLDQCVGLGPAFIIKHPPGDDDAFAQGLA